MRIINKRETIIYPHDLSNKSILNWNKPNINYLQVCECISCKYADLGEIDPEDGIPYFKDLLCTIYKKTKKPSDYCKRWKEELPEYTITSATQENQ